MSTGFRLHTYKGLPAVHWSKAPPTESDALNLRHAVSKTLWLGQPLVLRGAANIGALNTLYGLLPEQMQTCESDHRLVGNGCFHRHSIIIENGFSANTFRNPCSQNPFKSTTNAIFADANSIATCIKEQLIISQNPPTNGFISSRAHYFFMSAEIYNAPRLYLLETRPYLATTTDDFRTIPHCDDATIGLIYPATHAGLCVMFNREWHNAYFPGDVVAITGERLREPRFATTHAVKNTAGNDTRYSLVYTA